MYRDTVSNVSWSLASHHSPCWFFSFASFYWCSSLDCLYYPKFQFSYSFVNLNFPLSNVLHYSVLHFGVLLYFIIYFIFSLGIYLSLTEEVQEILLDFVTKTISFEGKFWSNGCNNLFNFFEGDIVSYLFWVSWNVANLYLYISFVIIPIGSCSIYLFVLKYTFRIIFY